MQKKHQVNCFFEFVSKYCTSLSDLYVNVGVSRGLKKAKNFLGEDAISSSQASRSLDAIFQIQTLRRVNIVDFKHIQYRPALTPRCKELRVLNLSSVITHDVELAAFIQVRILWALILTPTVLISKIRLCLIWKSSIYQKKRPLVQSAPLRLNNYPNCAFWQSQIVSLQPVHSVPRCNTW